MARDGPGEPVADDEHRADARVAADQRLGRGETDPPARRIVDRRPPAHLAADLGDPAALALTDAEAGEPAHLDEEGRDQAPGDDRADVRHDHVGQERPELLDVHPGAGLRFCNCLCCHVIS